MNPINNILISQLISHFHPNTQTLCNHSSRAPSPLPTVCSLTHGLAHSGGCIHLVATVTLTLVTPFQVDADLTADAGILALINVCAHRETDGEGRKTAAIFTCLILQLHEGNHHDTVAKKKF